jgi:hypothetical protein
MGKNQTEPDLQTLTTDDNVGMRPTTTNTWDDVQHPTLATNMR